MSSHKAVCLEAQLFSSDWVLSWSINRQLYLVHRKNNRLISGELFSSDRRPVSFGSSQLGFRFLSDPTLEKWSIKRDSEEAGVNKSGRGG